MPVELKGTIYGTKTHGYNLKSGGWCLYPIDKDAEPAEFMIFREYRKHKKIMINKKNIFYNKGLSTCEAT